MDATTIDANKFNATQRKRVTMRRKLRAEWLRGLYSTCGIVYPTLSAAHDAIATACTCSKLTDAQFNVVDSVYGFRVTLAAY